MSLSTHVLDASLGRPAVDVPVALYEQASNGSWRELLRGCTNADGRLQAVSSSGQPLRLTAGIHRVDFNTAAYFTASGQTGFDPA